MRTWFQRGLALTLVLAALTLGCIGRPTDPPPSEPQSARPEVGQNVPAAGGSPLAGTLGTGGLPSQAAPAQRFSTPNPGAPPAAPRGEITRTELFEDVVEIEGVRYRMLIVELVFGPRAETPVHVHPGPSAGYMQDGRITVSLPTGNRANTYSAGSAISHPWNMPHIFSNTSDDSVRMVSFELVPMR